MSRVSVRAFDAMAAVVGPQRNPDMTPARREAIYEALYLLERLEGDRRQRRKRIDPHGSEGRKP